MGGSASLVATVFNSLVGAVSNMSNRQGRSSDLAKERAAREAEQQAEEAEDRKRDRAKVMEARELEGKRKRTSLLSNGAASLEDEPETAAAKLKSKLGE